MKANTVIPAGFPVSYLPARVAKGAYKPKGNAIVGATSPRETAMPTMRRSFHSTTRASAAGHFYYRSKGNQAK